jgi:hypothetical protein
MSQTAHGDRNIQVAVTQSSNVVININGQRVIDLEVRPYPRPLQEKWDEIDLLKAAYAQIPFLGRDEILQEFVQWCEAPPAVSFRTLVGQGGAGKTRFAYELYARVKALPNWSAYFLHFYENSGKGIDLWSEIGSNNALLIADYASDSAKPLADLLRLLINPAPDGRRIRVLLLARTASWEQGWLASLTSGRTGEEVDRHFHPAEPIPLPSFTPEERHAIFQRTVETAAQRTGKPIPALPPPEAFAAEDVADRLADPLALMMAALITLESGAPVALYLNRAELAHEVAQRLVADRMKSAVSDHRELFLHMAACATLSGGLNEDEALAALKQESEATNLGHVPDPQEFLQTLQAWLPGGKEGAWIGSIDPDIVGEAFVLGRGARCYLRGAQQAVLRAVRRRAGPTISTVIRIVQDFSCTAKESRLEPLNWLTRLVEQGEADNDLSLLFEASNAMPRSSVVLRRVGLRISEAICVRLRLLHKHRSEDVGEIVQKALASSLITLAIRQREVGQREAALATAEEALELYRKLAGRNRDAFLPDLAVSLSNLATRQFEAGQRETSLATAQEAVELYRELVARNRDAFLPALAGSLSDLANLQSGTGQREAAQATAQEAVERYRELAGRNRDAFLPDLARALNNLASRQAEVGQREAALAAAQETIELRRELVGRNRDAFLPALAGSLNNLANAESGVGQREAALAAAKEALELYRELVGRNRDAFLPDLAMSLNNLANAESGVGQREAALATAREAVDLRRELVGRNRDAFLPDLAMSLSNLASRQAELGQREAALAAAKEAVELYRKLVGRNRDAFLPDLAMSLNSLANTQSELGQREAALATAEEALELYRKLAGRNRNAFVENLAISCLMFADTLREVGRFAAAQEVYEEAIRAVLPEVPKHPSVYVPLAAALLHQYFSNSEATNIAVDAALNEHAMKVLGPYRDVKGK